MLNVLDDLLNKTKLNIGHDMGSIQISAHTFFWVFQPPPVILHVVKDIIWHELNLIKYFATFLSRADFCVAKEEIVEK